MTAVNNFAGKITKEYNVFHCEKLSNGLYFIIYSMYKDSSFFIEAFISTGEKHVWTNSTIGYVDAYSDINQKEVYSSCGNKVHTIKHFDIYKWVVDISQDDLKKFCQ